MKTLNQNLMHEALHDYEAAKEELNRPEHDVVTHSVCHLTRKSICSMLEAYLSTKNISMPKNETMDRLVIQSIQCNPNLTKFDFNILRCNCLPLHDTPDTYCMSESKVNECFVLLESLKKYLFNEMMPLS